MTSEGETTAWPQISESGIASPATMEAGVGHSQEGEAGLQQAAEEGFANNLQRQLVRARAQLQAVEAKYQEKVQENDRNVSSMKRQLSEAFAQVDRLKEEKTILEEKYEVEKQEKEAAMKLANDLNEKRDSLQLEKEKVIKELAILHGSLRKAHQEVAMLKEKQGEMMQPESAAELTKEVAYMRQVIKNLKDMVLDQKERLGKCGMMLSMSSGSKSTMSRSYHSPGSMESNTSPLGSGRSAGSPSGQSWEVVNVSHPASLNTRQQQEQQQQQQLLAMQQRCVTSTSSTVSSYWTPHNMAANSSMTMKPPGVKMDASRMPGASNGLPPKMWGSHSAVIQRQSNIALPPKSRTEVLKPGVSNVSQPPDFTDGIFQPHFLGEGRNSQPLAHKLPLSHEMAGGLDRLGEVTGSAQRVTSPTRTHLVGAAAANQEVYLPQGMKGHPALPVVDSSSNKRTAPSMHILNPGVMAGARVIRNDSDNFGSSGGTVMASPLVPAVSGSKKQPPNLFPQEHDDVTPFAAGMPELSPLDETNFINAPVINQAGSGLDRKCPVCNQDFSHMTMDEFQSHVFECIDRTDENASAPETLQPETETKPGTGPAEQVCPMCDKRFPGSTTSQQYFEGHVQSHFDVGADPFEVLDIKEP